MACGESPAVMNILDLYRVNLQNERMIRGCGTTPGQTQAGATWHSRVGSKSQAARIGGKKLKCWRTRFHYFRSNRYHQYCHA